MKQEIDCSESQSRGDGGDDRSGICFLGAISCTTPSSRRLDRKVPSWRSNAYGRFGYRETLLAPEVNQG